MTIRGDVYIDWNASPRIIWVESPSTELILQDLVDTVRELEAEEVNLAYDHILDAAGKDVLGGGVYVGITVTLNNAQVAFEARGGPSFVQCNVSGGNLVAVDDIGNDITPIYTTAYTQVVRTSSSSATLQELADIQYSSYNSGVTIDVTSTYTGTDYPIGTPREPVNNVADAVSIAASRGFTKLYVLGDITFDSSANINSFTIQGSGSTNSIITINPNASVYNTAFTEALITGTLDGSCRIEKARVTDLNYVSGIISDCIFEAGTTQLSNGEVYIINCVGEAVASAHPIIDFNNSTAKVAIRNFGGDLVLTNKTGSEQAEIGILSGSVIIDSTVTNGTIVINGIGNVIDNSTGNAVVDTSALVQASLKPADIESAVWNAIIESGVSSTQYSAKDLVRLFSSALLGKVSGMANNQPVFRDLADDKARITANTTSDGDRIDVTLDPT